MAKEAKKQSYTLQLAKHLLEDCNMSAKAVSKRLHIKYSRLLRIQNDQINDPSIAFLKYKPRLKFKKLHNRAKDVINELLVNSQKPLQIPDIAKEIKNRTQLTISNNHLRMYIRQNLDVSYRQLRPVSQNYNTIHAKLERQLAAMHYIDSLHQGGCIINVDESVIQLKSLKKRSWLPRGIKNRAILPNRPNLLNIIAGISNKGQFFFTINKGKTNGQTFYLFLLKLCEKLQRDDKNWRLNTLIMVDNAGYHRGQYISERIKRLKIPIFYLGPYHFKMAPIEKFFANIKSNDLNPLDSKLTSEQGIFTQKYRKDVRVFMKELCMHISRVNMDWIPGVFMHVLSAALEDLALTDM